jgi:integrase
VGRAKRGKPASNPTPGKKSQRSHDPAALGSRVYLDRERYHIDLHWLGHGRPLMRNPDTRGWPSRGEPTSCLKTAEKWRQRYDEHFGGKRSANGKGLNRRRLAIEAATFVRNRELMSHSSGSAARTAMLHLREGVGDDVDPVKITDFALQAICNNRLEDGYKRSTVNTVLSQWKVFFDGLKIRPNPARDVVLPKEEAGDIKPWDESECARIRAAADALDREAKDGITFHRRLTEYLLNTGARIQEAAAAHAGDVDKRDKIARIAKQISRKNNTPVSTKGREPRTVVVLHQWWPHQPRKGSSLMFAAPDGSPIRYRELYDVVRAILEKAGLKKPGEAAHQFRHTYAFLFLQRGGRMDQLQKSLGHKRMSTTSKYYDHFTSDHAARAGVKEIYGPELGPKSKRRGPRKR